MAGSMARGDLVSLLIVVLIVLVILAVIRRI
jgi:hypothetical protein